VPIQRTLVVGATSAIGEHVARALAARGGTIYITGRNTARLDSISADLLVRGANQVLVEQLDVTDATALDGLITRAAQTLGGLDAILFAAGLLPDAAAVASDPQLLRRTLDVNATSAMVVLNQAAALFEQQGSGQIVAIGSVAGDRGRTVNYAYGAAKGALEVFLSGLRQRLHPRGIQVLLVKPGFVDTPMTAGFTKGPLWASPEGVARDIVKAMEQHQSVIYTPWFWRWIMLLIRLIPEKLFVRLRF
jgi:decaprenylphospho-beta-D-erythro-pentofuranosid-2-ulose 2-reductase